MLTKKRRTSIDAVQSLIKKDKSALSIIIGILVAMFFLLIGAIALLVSVSGWIIIWQDGLGIQEILVSLPWGLLGISFILLSASIFREFIIIFPKRDIDYKIILVIFFLLLFVAILFIFFVFSLFTSDLLFGSGSGILLLD